MAFHFLWRAKVTRIYLTENSLDYFVDEYCLFLLSVKVPKIIFNSNWIDELVAMRVSIVTIGTLRSKLPFRVIFHEMWRNFWHSSKYNTENSLKILSSLRIKHFYVKIVSEIRNSKQKILRVFKTNFNFQNNLYYHKSQWVISDKRGK